MGWIIHLAKLISIPFCWIAALLVGHRVSKREMEKSITDCSGVAASITAGIASENKHIESRFQWKLGLQGFLYASYALAIGRSDEGSDPNVIEGFADIVSMIGLWSCGITLLGLLAAFTSINFYKMQWLSHKAKLDKVSVRPFSGTIPSLAGRIPSLGITAVLFWGWLRLESLFS